MYLIYALIFIFKIECSNLTNFIEHDIKIFASNANHIFLGLNDIRSTLISKSKYNNLTNFISDAWITPSQSYFKIRFGDNPICSSNSDVIKCSVSSDWQFDKKTLGYTIGNGTKCITLNDNEIIKMTNCIGSNDQLFDFRMALDEKPCDKKEKKDKDIIVINLSGSNNCGSLTNEQCLQSLDSIRNCGCNKDIIPNVSEDIESKNNYEPKPILQHEIYDNQIYKPSLFSEIPSKEIINEPYISLEEPKQTFLKFVNFETKKPERKKIKVTKVLESIPEIVDKNSMIRDLVNTKDDNYLTYYEPKSHIINDLVYPVNDDVFSDTNDDSSDNKNILKKKKEKEKEKEKKKKKKKSLWPFKNNLKNLFRNKKDSESLKQNKKKDKSNDKKNKLNDKKNKLNDKKDKLNKKKDKKKETKNNLKNQISNKKIQKKKN